MVLKNLVRYIINKYLKDYIEELDYEKLKLDLKNGHVTLEKLHLKPEALVDLSLPVTVATGYLEKLTLIIPWKNLYSHPTKVYINGLYMLIVPKNEVRRDFTGYYEDKMRRVQRKVENLRKATLNHQKLDEKESTFIERMRLQIMQNLQITIENIHLSYETISTTKLGHPFSFGLTISHLEMTTTTNQQTIGRVKEHSLVIFKMKEIQALSLYWNTKCQSRIEMSFDDVVEDLKSKIASNTHTPQSDEMNYILHPVNLTIDLTITLQPGEYNFERPAYDIDIHVEELRLNIDPKQFSDLLDFIKFQNYTKLYDRCREYRELQIALNTLQLTSEQNQRLHYLETKLDVFNLAYIRHSVEMEMNPLQLGQQQHPIKTNRGITTAVPTRNNHKWWNSWWKANNYSKEGERRRSSTASSNINHGEFLAEDSPNIDIKIQVKNLALNLSFPPIQSSLLTPILCPIQIKNARIDFKRRAVSSNILFIIDLQSFSLFGMQIDTRSRPLLVTAASKPILPLIHVELEFSPMDKKSDYRFYLIIEPLTIAYDAPTINQIVECFDPNDDQLSSTSLQIQRRTKEEMEEDLSQEKVFEMIIQLKGISLLLPENGVQYRDSSMIYINLDSLILKSCLDEDKDNHYSLSKKERQQLRFYTKYKLKLSNLRITYSPSENLQFHILRRLHLLDMNFYKCIYSDDAYLADWRIVAKIDKLTQIELSKSVLIKLIRHLKSVPLFYSNMLETLHRVNLYFIIFPSHTTVEVDLLIHRCFLLLTQFRTSILTDIGARISKTRDNENDMKISLNNLTMAHQTKPLIKQKSSWLFHRTQSIEFIYKNDLITRL